MRKGFTLVETLITIGIMAMLATISVVSFGNYTKRESLYASSSALSATIREARSRTLASLGGYAYGVKIDADRFTLFKGTTFSSSTADASYIFPSSVRASTTVNTFVFARVTGNSSASGTIDIYLASDPAVKKSFLLELTGLVTIQ